MTEKKMITTDTAASTSISNGQMEIRVSAVVTFENWVFCANEAKHVVRK